MAEDFLGALTGPMLPCEEQGGWILQQLDSGMRTSTLRAQVAALADLLDYFFTDSVALGFELQRWSPLVNVSQYEIYGLIVCVPLTSVPLTLAASYLFYDSSFRSQTMKERLAGWRRSLKSTENEAEEHFLGQAERIVSLELQQRFLEVRNQGNWLY